LPTGSHKNIAENANCIFIPEQKYCGNYFYLSLKL